MRWDIFWRYVLEFTMLYPGAALCYLPAGNHLRFPPRRLFPLVFASVSALILAGSLTCTLLSLSTNMLILPIFVLTFLVYRRTLSPDLTTGKPLYIFSAMTSMLAACTVLTSLLAADQELNNPEAVWLASSSLLCLGLSLPAILLYVLLMRRRHCWLMAEFHAPRIWRIAWLLPASFTWLYMMMNPQHPATVLVNRVQRMGVLLLIASVAVFHFLTLLYYRIAKELTLNARLAAENQMLSIEANRYHELRVYMEQTRVLRHDFRQHLRVISNLTDAGQTDELKQYLRQYDQELGGERVTLCANAAVDAIAGYYDHYAVSHEIPIHWKLSLPEELPLPETDICMLMGNLLENALHASGLLPVEQRRVRVICQMLSPAMLGLIVENAYNGMLNMEGSAFLSTRHGGAGFGLQSVQNTVRRYHGKLTFETENQVFSVNVLLNL